MSKKSSYKNNFRQFPGVNPYATGNRLFSPSPFEKGNLEAWINFMETPKQEIQRALGIRPQHIDIECYPEEDGLSLSVYFHP